MPESRVVPAIPLDESQDLTGRLAWIHWGSETARFVMVQRPLLRRLSNCSRASGKKKLFSVFCNCSILRTLSLVINIIIITIITTIVFSI